MFEIDGFRFSQHALERALDMQLKPDEIRKCLERPNFVEQCRTKRDCDLYTRDRITISVVRDLGLVATILWSSRRHWRMDEVRGRKYRHQNA